MASIQEGFNRVSGHQSAWKDNPKIKDLTKTAEDQKNEIEELQQKIAASQVALAKEEVATFELDKKVTQQAQKVRNGEILVTHLNRELKERKESEEWMNDRKKEKTVLNGKSHRELKNELKYKKVLSDKERELKKNQQQRKAEICELAAQISAYEAECERRGLNIEADKKMKINMTGLKKNQQQRKAEICELATQISAYEAECERRGLNIEADKKMKINMTGTIEFLRQKNDALLRELTSGIVGKIRIVKRFFGAAISAITARFH
ncbi:hypothetical protein AWC38_SpisGene22698 [Stylophora pistillata]|uniref:Uncharacterized protein n=1 Tax=Stylophora pistillata TaxID=50429 RepID=A0A2B4RA25_STYPI|nr:hypothetical protein AWC38_SpisGene22698 [Stylophora pistillata]